LVATAILPALLLRWLLLLLISHVYIRITKEVLVLIKAWEVLLDVLLCLVYVMLVLSVLALKPSDLIVRVRLAQLHVLKTYKVILSLQIALSKVVRVKIIHVSWLIILRINLAHEML
jgi:hypothetical protein